MRTKPEPCNQYHLYSKALNQSAVIFGIGSDEFWRIFERAKKHFETCQQCLEYANWLFNPELEKEEPQADPGKPAWGQGV